MKYNKDNKFYTKNNNLSNKDNKYYNINNPNYNKNYNN